MHSYSKYTKPGKTPPVTPLWGTGTCPVSVVTPTTVLDPLKHPVLNSVFQVLFSGDGSSESTVSSAQGR